MLMALRINVLAKGYSGITQETLSQYVAALNKNCVPWVPEVLSPLHLFSPLSPLLPLLCPSFESSIFLFVLHQITCKNKNRKGQLEHQATLHQWRTLL
jgi:hypothetical protein